VHRRAWKRTIPFPLSNFRSILLGTIGPASRTGGWSLRTETSPEYPQTNDGIRSDPDLAAVVAAWVRLPAAVKAGIVAMVQAAAK
jgi:hypothetical protein